MTFNILIKIIKPNLETSIIGDIINSTSCQIFVISNFKFVSIGVADY